MRQIASKFKFVVIFTAIFTIFSFLFSFVSWGQPISDSHDISDLNTKLPGLLGHMAEHALLGALAALPTLSVAPVLTAALGAMFIDVDHVGYFSGLLMEGRTSHSLIFAVISGALVFWLTRRGWLGREVKPQVAASIAVASVLAHISLDSITGDPLIPLWMPFYRALVTVPPPGGVLIEAIAVIVVWAATVVPYRWGRFSKRQPAA